MPLVGRLKKSMTKKPVSMTTSATNRHVLTKHLLRRSERELGGVRYFAACGYSGVSSRDFAANYTRRDRDGRIVWVVNCNACVNGVRAVKIGE
jgi:hypothetical protein